MNKGFSLIEMLLVLLVVSMLNQLYLNHNKLMNINEYTNIAIAKQNISNIQIESLISVRRNCLNSMYILSNHEVCFNAKGNVNQAQTLSVLKSDKSIVLHLGSGLYETK